MVDKEDVQRLLNLWRDRLLIPEIYEVEVRLLGLEEEFGNITWYHDKWKCSINIAYDMLPETARETVAHELLHILLAPLMRKIRHLLEYYVPNISQEYEQHDLDNITDLIIEQLSRILLKAYEKQDKLEERKWKKDHASTK